MPDILITENITGKAIDALRRDRDVAFEPDLWRSETALRAAVRTAKALIVRNQTHVTAALLESASHLQIVARAGVGLDNVDVDTASSAGVVVSYTPNENSLSVAELTIGLIIALARKIPVADRDTRGGGWNRHQFAGFEVSGKTLGVVGFGRIGHLVATRAKLLGMSVIAHDEFIDPAAPHLRELDVQLVALNELLQRADFVTCHVPLTDPTRGMMDESRLGQMKSTAMLINTSRGEIVDEPDLIRALQDGRIAGAALDVRGSEPPGDGPLNEMDNVILTPHIAAFTREAQERVVAAVCRDVRAVLDGEPAVNPVNFARPKRPT